jgi:hypothetical protein
VRQNWPTTERPMKPIGTEAKLFHLESIRSVHGLKYIILNDFS